MEKWDKDSELYRACRAFLHVAGVDLRTRYLLFRLCSLSPDEQKKAARVRDLAEKLGFNKDTMSKRLRLLVVRGALQKSMLQTGGRPSFFYQIAPEFEAALSSLRRRRIDEKWLGHLLVSNQRPFESLSISERVFLVLLWSRVKVARACVLAGVGGSRLARLAGVDRSTVHTLLSQLQAKGILIQSRADFTADGRTNKTKVYFLLGPELLACWPVAFTWYIDANDMLDWLLGRSDALDVEELASMIPPRFDRKIMQIWLLEFLRKPQDRYYLLIQLCSAISIAFSAKGCNLWVDNSLYTEVERALLNILGLPVTGPGEHHAAIENLDLRKLDIDVQTKVAFVEQFVIRLIAAFRKDFPFELFPGGPLPFLLSCYPEENEVAKRCFRLRMDVVFESEVAGVKFKEFLKASGVAALPEQLKIK